MKLVLSILPFVSFTLAASAAVFTNSPDADAFVRADAPTFNYGAAGALSVSGASATNVNGVANGVFDSVVRCNTSAMVTNFNLLFGSNNWVISSATLQVTETGAPSNTLFNRGKGAFEIRWFGNDNWTEGMGNPMTPTTSGITYNSEATLLNSLTDLSLGTFTNAGADVVLNFPLSLPVGFTADLQAGGEVSLYLRATETNTGFTINARTFGTVSVRPYLIITAIPQPGIANISLSGTNIVFTATNGVAGGTYYVLTSGTMTAPVNQWTSVLTNVPVSSGNFNLTVTNVPSTNDQQFFLLRAQ